MNLGLEMGTRDSRRDREPHFLILPTPQAPAAEAAVWMTSSHKHALFLRKWKVSEVWWPHKPVRRAQLQLSSSVGDLGSRIVGWAEQCGRNQ